MWNYAAIDKTPTVYQVKAIIDYMERDPSVPYAFTNMMEMKRVGVDTILLDLNNGYFGNTFEIIFNQNEIVTFKNTGFWMS